jgi:hypothetical protein
MPGRQGDSGPQGLDRRAQIGDVADGVFEAIGLSDKRFDFDYERTPAASCAIEMGLEEGTGPGEAWYARQSYALLAGTYDDDAMITAAARHFTSEGYETQLYRRVNDLRALVAVKGDVGVIMRVGTLLLTVSAGPCGRSVSALGDPWTPEPA